MTPLRVVVVGQGYVGLPLAMRAVDAGHDVVGYEVDVDRVKCLADGDSFVEDVGADDVRAALATGRYLATDDLAALTDFDVAVLTVPTPLRDGAPDLGFVESASSAVATYVTPGCLVVLESTTYPGTTEELVVDLLERGSGLQAGGDFSVGYSPERIDPGNRQWTLESTPKIVSGIDERSLARTDAFYATIVARTVPVSSPRSAELAKLLENTFRHVNIALVNELAMVAQDLGVDVWEAIDAASTKPFGFMRFTPGPGVGGHCLPVDPSYLSWSVQRSTGAGLRFVELANDVNDHMPDHVLARLEQALGRRGRSLPGARVLVLGLAYKKNTSDARESPAIALAERLVTSGAVVATADPHVVEDVVGHLPVERVELDPDQVAMADAVVLLTDHDDFDFSILAGHPCVLDTRHVLRFADVDHL